MKDENRLLIQNFFIWLGLLIYALPFILGILKSISLRVAMGIALTGTICLLIGTFLIKTDEDKEKENKKQNKEVKQNATEND